MDYALRVALLLVLIGLVSTTINESLPEDDFEHCENTVKQWAASSLHLDVKEDSHILRDLLFFLHIPRTGGRTYFYCFLKKLYSGSLECPRSYDKLRFDPSKPKCRLLVTHDDYSMMSKLPRERASVVTILRQPIDRIFSTYEFSIEVAARFLVHPNLTSATRMAGRLRAKTHGVSTLDIWPWKYLVPWMREDLFARREARKNRDPAYTKSNDSYNMEGIVMPLHEYINDPIARDIIHNGATFQVAGLTNNSYTRGSHEVRHCVTKYRTLGKYVLDVAKKRLDDMLYVGLTENHRESATMFANVVGAQVISQLMAPGLSAANNISEQSSSLPDSNSDTSRHENSSTNQKAQTISSPEIVEATNENMTVGKLMESYETCISSLRKSQTQRRISSLKQISPANFTREARHNVPEALLQEIMSLNTLDMELYKYAEDIFARKHKQMVQTSGDTEKQESVFKTSYTTPSWELLSLTVTLVLLVLFISLFVNAKRKTFKLKI